MQQKSNAETDDLAQWPPNVTWGAWCCLLVGFQVHIYFFPKTDNHVKVSSTSPKQEVLQKKWGIILQGAPIQKQLPPLLLSAS